MAEGHHSARQKISASTSTHPGMLLLERSLCRLVKQRRLSICANAMGSLRRLFSRISMERPSLRCFNKPVGLVRTGQAARTFWRRLCRPPETGVLRLRVLEMATIRAGSSIDVADDVTFQALGAPFNIDRHFVLFPPLSRAPCFS